MIQFILNDQHVQCEKPPGTSLLDFIRHENDLSGTKIGCREGDCGACTVMEGTLDESQGQVKYKSIVSCLTPLANIHGKHIVTVEGLNMPQLSPVQQAIIEEGATQCGFCTPGIVLSLTAYCLSATLPKYEKAISSIDGNICRCTGYKSIERAVRKITDWMPSPSNDPVKQMVKNGFLPAYFDTIPQKLAVIGKSNISLQNSSFFLGGGTDLMVQKPDEIRELEIVLPTKRKISKGIQVTGETCKIGAATTMSEIMGSPIIQKWIPGLFSFFKHIASTPIRNMGTLGGNIANASPVGDLNIFFLALNAKIKISHPENGRRTLPFKDFFLAYKKVDLRIGEYIDSIQFLKPEPSTFFNFEKVSKRTYLDIASVNTAISLTLEGDIIKEVHLSAGGVSPTPLYLSKTVDFLKDKFLTTKSIVKANEIMQSEIEPISDIRGSITYKRLLLRQLFFAHFLKGFPENIASHSLLTEITNEKH
ncbi:MAG: 2Fe-2S iron-sulfur cluster binding domain-containing protein [Bacteroidetes bacterium]|nr:2Fe-2S iron-sulfur cluster binding domain-containing protein [Bacteroidota bacterium]